MSAVYGIHLAISLPRIVPPHTLQQEMGGGVRGEGNDWNYQTHMLKHLVIRFYVIYNDECHLIWEFIQEQFIIVMKSSASKVEDGATF